MVAFNKYIASCSFTIFKWQTYLTSHIKYTSMWRFQICSSGVIVFSMYVMKKVCLAPHTTRETVADNAIISLGVNIFYLSEIKIELLLADLNFENMCFYFSKSLAHSIWPKMWIITYLHSINEVQGAYSDIHFNSCKAG